VKPVERESARRLRREDGLALGVIAERLGVSKSSVSVWTRDIPLTEEQHERLRQANPIYNQQLRGQEGRRASARAARLAAQEHGREVARPRRSAAPPRLHALLGRGFEEPQLRCIRQQRFLRDCCDVADERITLRVNCHLNNGLSLEEIEARWLAELRLPRSCVRAATVNRPSSASRWRRNVYVYGTAAIRVDSTFIVQSIYGAIQEYGGFDRPAWLD
jgi:transcriptional regulator with XRE-family HTH domain